MECETFAENPDSETVAFTPVCAELSFEHTASTVTLSVVSEAVTHTTTKNRDPTISLQNPRA